MKKTFAKRTVLVILVLAMLFALPACDTVTVKEKADLTPSVVYARKNEDGEGFLYWEKNSFAKMPYPIEKAAITADRQHLVILDEDLTLVCCDSDFNNKQTLCNEADSYYSLKIRNDGVIYRDTDKKYYRYSFSDGETMTLIVDYDSYDSVTFAENSTATLLAENGKIYIIAPNSTEKTKVGTYSDYVQAAYISDDGNTAVWVLDNGEKEYTPVVYSNGESQRLSTCTSGYYDYFYTQVSSDGNFIVLYSYLANCIYFIAAGKEPVNVTLPDTYGWGNIYTPSGLLEAAEATAINYLYIPVDGEEDDDIYAITPDGDRERLLSNVEQFSVYNGNIIYLKDSELYYAKLDGAELGEAKRLSGEVWSFNHAYNNANTIFYLKNYDTVEGTGTLYAYRLGSETPVKVAADVHNLYTSTDGNTAYYFKDYDEGCGTLYRWTYSEKEAESVKIKTDILVDSLDSYLESGDIRNDFFVFSQMTSKTGGYTCYNLYSYNGTEATKPESDLVD